MKKIILTLGIILISMIGICQEFLKSNDKEPEINQVDKSEKYVIGIGNESSSVYWQVLDYLQNSTYVKVIASCQLHQVIAVKVLDEEFKSYDEFFKYLKFEFEDLVVWRKDFDIFTKDCKDEYLKQKK